MHARRWHASRKTTDHAFPIQQSSKTPHGPPTSLNTLASPTCSGIIQLPTAQELLALRVEDYMCGMRCMLRTTSSSDSRLLQPGNVVTYLGYSIVENRGVGMERAKPHGT